MKMSGRVTVYCVALALTLTSVSAVKRLNSIKDLKKINFGQSVPEHSLVLLYWFANIVDVGRNDIWLTFDPDNGDYGSHYYSNFEGLLDRIPGHRCYTIGNLNQDRSVELPPYVVNHRMAGMGGNRARIIVRVEGSNSGWQEQRIYAVYITQHYETFEHEGTRYDPQHTYEISINLLREIREFSVGNNQRLLTSLRDRYVRNTNDYQLNDIRNTWGNLAGLGLLLFIVIQENNSNTHNRPQRAARRNTRADCLVDFPENRLNDWNADASHTCTYVVLIIIILLFIFFLTFFTGRQIT